MEVGASCTFQTRPFAFKPLTRWKPAQTMRAHRKLTWSRQKLRTEPMQWVLGSPGFPQDRNVHCRAINAVSSILLSAGIFMLGAALVILAITSIPLLLEMRRTAQQMQRVASALEKEIPDTASTMRLTGLELADAIQEVSLLSSDVTRGLQSTARSMQMMETTVKQGANFVQATTTEKLIPAIRSKVPTARGVVEERLLANVKLQYSLPEMLQLASNTKKVARRIRMALAAADLYTRASAISTYALTLVQRPPDRLH